MEFESPTFRRSCSTGDRDEAGAIVMRLRLTTAAAIAVSSGRSEWRWAVSSNYQLSAGIGLTTRARPASKAGRVVKG